MRGMERPALGDFGPDQFWHRDDLLLSCSSDHGGYERGWKPSPPVMSSLSFMSSGPPRCGEGRRPWLVEAGDLLDVVPGAKVGHDIGVRPALARLHDRHELVEVVLVATGH